MYEPIKNNHAWKKPDTKHYKWFDFTYLKADYWFGVDRNVLYLDWGDVYRPVYICQDICWLKGKTSSRKWHIFFLN